MRAPELLKQQAETDYWKAIANGRFRRTAESSRAKFAELDEEFAFIAACNLGEVDDR
ncbi:hypothetical protein O9992_26485 [Vibrio lentus]|nr:hypothetical protein [Vibrio lentus]